MRKTHTSRWRNALVLAIVMLYAVAALTTAAGTFAYTRADQILEVTDGASGAPATWNDAYTADQAGTLTLLDGTIDADPDTFSLTYAVQPADDKAVKLTATCTARSGATCDFAGTDAWGNAQTENGIDISSGSATSTKYFAAIDAAGITVDGMTNGDDFDVAQGRWGVVWERVADGDYYISANLHVGDGSTATYFQSKNELVYFANGYTFQAEDQATLELGDLVGEYGIDGSTWRIGLSAHHAVIAYGQTAATFKTYASTLIHQANYKFRAYSGRWDARNLTVLGDRNAGTDNELQLTTGLTVDWKSSFVSHVYELLIYGTPTAWDSMHIHDCLYPMQMLASMTIPNIHITSVAGVEYFTGGTNTAVILDPVTPVASVSNAAAGDVTREDYTVNANIHDPAGDDLAGVTVLCTRAHLMLGTDTSTVYRCIADIAVAADTHKPSTGATWAQYWSATGYAASAGGDWTTGASYAAAEEEWSVATGAQPGIATDGAVGYVDLTTANNYLNDLRAGEFAIVQVYKTAAGFGASQRLASAETLADLSFVICGGASSPQQSIHWTGAAGISTYQKDFGTWLDPHSLVLVLDSANARSCRDGALVLTDAYATLTAADAAKVRLGARARDGGNPASATFGPFFILDLTGVGAVDAAFSLSLATAINTACVEHDYDPDAIRAAIIAVDANIAGVYWKLDEAGTSGSFDSQTVIRYDVTDGSVDAANGGTSSAGGCDGAVVGAEAGDIAEQMITVKRWSTTTEILEACEHTFEYFKSGYRTLTKERRVVAEPQRLHPELQAPGRPPMIGVH